MTGAPTATPLRPRITVICAANFLDAREMANHLRLPWRDVLYVRNPHHVMGIDSFDVAVTSRFRKHRGWQEIWETLRHRAAVSTNGPDLPPRPAGSAQYKAAQHAE